MPQTVIYGPPATGKTFHADLFKAHYGAARVIDDWDVAFGPGPRDDDLILSADAPADLRKRYPRAQLIRIDAARSAVGLDPAPPGGFTRANRRDTDTISTPLGNSIVLDIDVDIDAARTTLAGLSNGFSLSEAADALSWDGPHAPLKKLVMTAGFLPFKEHRGRRFYAIGKEARRARVKAVRGIKQALSPDCTAMLSHDRVSELLDYASVYGEFDENTPIGTQSSHGSILSEGQLHAIIAYKKVLCLMPVDAKAPTITQEQDRRVRMEACPCACHENRCGSADIAMAQYALALVARCSNADDAVAIHELVERAGPEFARIELEKLRTHVDASTDEEVPF